MTTLSMADFALHVQDYLNQVVQGEHIKIRLPDEQVITLTVEPNKKTYTKTDLLRDLSYQGTSEDSQLLDNFVY